MCEYCGCLDVPAIAELTAEHDLVVTLGGQALRALEAGDLDTAAARARAIAAVLAPHTAVEEGALFPAILDEVRLRVGSAVRDTTGRGIGG